MAPQIITLVDDEVDTIEILSDDDWLSDSSTERGDSEIENTASIYNQPTPRRNLPITFSEISLGQVVTPSGIRLKIDDTVELKSEHDDTYINRDGDFLRIKHIFKDSTTGKLFLRGWRFRRNTLMKGLIVPPKLNEVILLIDQELDDQREILVQGMSTVEVESIFKKKRLIITNNHFPTYTFRSHTAFSTNGPAATETRNSIRDSSELVCRWIVISRFETSFDRSSYYKKVSREEADGRTRVHTDGLIRRIRAAEADEQYTVKDSFLLSCWLGNVPWQQGDDSHQRECHRSAADICCGAGFASRGMKDAGFEVTWALDLNEDAIATYNINHPEVTTYCVDLGDFVHFVADEHYVEILHCSFPCQWFSPAHTHEGENDEANTAAIFALREVLCRVRPRMVSFEQTSGLLTHKPIWARAVFLMFTEIGYNVVWRKTDLANYGLAHARKRLIIIASCPGSALPSFPDPSHGPNGYYPYLTIADALETLGNTTGYIDRHNPTAMARLNFPPYPATIQLRNTITTGGTTAYHPSGLRKFTIREAILLQSAPLGYRIPAYLSNSEAMRQIGNAFPTKPACAIFTSIRLALDKEDAELASEDQTSGWMMLHRGML